MRTRDLAAALAASVCIVAIATPAQAQTREYRIPSGSLKSALDAYARQSGRQVIYRVDDIRGARSPGARGNLTAEAALNALLAGTGFDVRADSSGALAIVRQVAGTSPAESSSESASSLGDVGVSAEEIIVTAQKREERAIDVPASLTVIRAENLLQNEALRLEDYYTKVPGLNFTLGGNGGQPQISIRGLTTGDTLNPTVGVVIDDVPYGASVISTSPPDIDPSEIENIVVLRGPQGTLYGASSIGGLLKFTTIEPSPAGVSGRIQAGISSVRHGDDLGYSLRGAVNLPLGRSAALRMSGFRVRAPGYVDNVQTGEEDVNRRESKGARAAFAWRPADYLSIRLSALLQEARRPGSPDVNRNFGGAFRQSALRGTGLYNRASQVYSGSVELELGSVTLTSLTGYNIDQLDDNLDLSANAFQSGQAQSRFGVTGVSVPLMRDVESFTQEFRSAASLGPDIEWIVGLFFTDQQIDGGNDVVAVDPATGRVAGLMLRNTLPNTYREYAAFSNVAIDLTEALQVQLGGRYTENRQTFSITRSGPLSTVFFGSDPFILPQVESAESPLTYLGTIRYEVSPRFNVYARAASGYRPGGPNISCGAANIPCTYEADRTENYEIGAKAIRLDGTLSIDASIYHIFWKNIQVSSFSSGLVFTVNGPRAKSQGAELSLAWQPGNGTSISGWIGYNDAELTEDFPLISLSPGRAGDRLPFSSRFSGNLSVDHSVELTSAAQLRLGSSLSYVGRREGLFRGGSQTRVSYPGYFQLDVSAGVEVRDWTFTAYVNNLTGTRGILRDGLDSVSPSLVTYTQPRMIGLSIARSF